MWFLVVEWFLCLWVKKKKLLFASLANSYLLSEVLSHLTLYHQKKWHILKNRVKFCENWKLSLLALNVLLLDIPLNSMQSVPKMLSCKPFPSMLNSLFKLLFAFDYVNMLI